MLDDLAYNQNESRELLAVPDLLLRCRIAAGGSGLLWLRIDDGRQKFEVQLDAETGRGEVWSAGDRLRGFWPAAAPWIRRQKSCSRWSMLNCA